MDEQPPNESIDPIAETIISLIDNDVSPYEIIGMLEIAKNRLINDLEDQETSPSNTYPN